MKEIKVNVWCEGCMRLCEENEVIKIPEYASVEEIEEAAFKKAIEIAFYNKIGWSFEEV